MSAATAIRIADITIVDRFRVDYGDIDGLADSIKANGLLQPIAVTSDLVLLDGERRIKATTQLGHSTIAAHIVDPDELVRAERDANTVRKDFTPHRGGGDRAGGRATPQGEDRPRRHRPGIGRPTS